MHHCYPEFIKKSFQKQPEYFLTSPKYTYSYFKTESKNNQVIQLQLLKLQVCSLFMRINDWKTKNHALWHLKKLFFNPAQIKGPVSQEEGYFLPAVLQDDLNVLCISIYA